MSNNQQPNQYEDYDEIDLREIFKTLGKWKWTIAGVTIGAMLLAGIISSFFMTPIYEATAVITAAQIKELTTTSSTNYILKEQDEFHRIDENTVTMPVASIDTGNYIQLLKSSWVLEQTIKKLKLDITPAALKGMIKAETPKVGTAIEVRVSHRDPALAQQIANTLVEELELYIKKMEKEQIDRVYQVLEKQQEAAQNEFDEILTRYSEYKIKKAASGSGSLQESINAQLEETKLQNAISRRSDAMDLLNAKKLELKLTRSFIESGDSIIVLSPAVEPVTPVSPNTKLNIAITGVLALMLTIFAVFLIEYLREESEG